MRILFQGDSITDAGRNTNNGSLISIGQGYAMLVDSILSTEYPRKFEFINRGVSGDRIVDIYARIKADCWNLSPDVLSILVGINDVWHEIYEGNGVDAERFERVYDMLVCDTLKRLPETHIMILEPFVLEAEPTKEHWTEFSGETRLRAKAAHRIAKKYNLTFIPLQSIFDNAAKANGADYWLGDGIHPTPAGHQLIANEWCKAFRSEILHTNDKL